MVLLFGPPGVGKSTQADLVAKKYKFVRFSMGDVLREEVASHSALANKIEKYLNRGALVPDDVVLELAKKFLQENKNAHVLFDGFPRTISQAMSLDTCLTELGLSVSIALEIHLSEEEIMKRLSHRGYCPSCGAVYNFITNPPKLDKICDTCGQKLVTRSDDNEDVIRQRLKVYEEETQNLAEHYKSPSVYKKIDASGSQQKVFKKISDIIDAYINKR